MSFLARLLFLAMLFCLIVPCDGEAKALRVGYLQGDIHHLPLWVALEKGMFPKEGIQVEVGGIFRAGPEEMSAFSAGALDVGYVGLAPTITAFANKTVDVSVVAQVNMEGSQIVVKQGSGIKDMMELKGKTIAIPGYSTVQDFLLRKALQVKDFNPNDYKIVVLKPPEMIAALAGSQIEAFIAWEPFPSKSITSGIATTLMKSREIWPGHPCCVLVVQSDLIKNSPELVYSYVKAHKKAIEFVNSNIEEARKIASKYTGMDESTIKFAMDNVKYEAKLNIRAVRDYVEYLTKFKYITVENSEQFLKSLITEKFLEESSK
jgi:NitT/TauT family transport system substrate-binding protein